MNSKRTIWVLIILLVLVVGILSYKDWVRPANQSDSANTVVPVALSSISAPNGWTTQESSTSQAIFSKNTTSSTSGDGLIYASWGTIHVDVIKINQPFQDWARQSLDTNIYGPFSSAQTWNVINGHLILGSVGKEDLYNSLNYLVVDNNVIYSFSLGPYGINQSTVKNNPVNTGDVKTLQTMVQNFAESLPAK